MEIILQKNAIRNSVFNTVNINNHTKELFSEKTNDGMLTLIEATPDLLLKVPIYCVHNILKYVDNIENEHTILLLEYKTKDYIYFDFIGYGIKKPIEFLKDEHTLILNKDLEREAFKNNIIEESNIHIDTFCDLLNRYKKETVWVYQIKNNFNPKTLKIIKNKNFVFSTVIDRRILVSKINIKNNHLYSFAAER